ncbi:MULTISPECIES: XAC2610-related protein [Chitinophagaceae]
MMNKCLLLLVFHCLSVLFSQAQKNNIAIQRNYSGTIGTYPVQVKIQQFVEKDSISGSYYYIRNGKENDMSLTGSVKNNEWEILEYEYSRKLDKSINTGAFALRIDSAGSLNGTWTGANKKLLPVTLKGYLNSWVDTILSWKFQPRYYRKKAENAGGVMQDYWAINRINITTGNGKLVQTLSGFDEIVDDRSGVLEFEDCNFDGYPDLKLVVNYPEQVKEDWSFLYFLFNPISRTFVSNKALDNLGILSFDPGAKKIYHYSADGSGNETQSDYKWFGDKFFIVREEKTYENKPGIYITEYTIQEGKSVVLKEYKK